MMPRRRQPAAPTPASTTERGRVRGRIKGCGWDGAGAAALLRRERAGRCASLTVLPCR